MKLLIVESPNKIKKLQSLLGSDWEVAASVGHIRDLPAKELAIDKNNGYKMQYQVKADKQDVVANLKRKVGRVSKANVYLATDPDREGEAISFHLCAALGLDYRTTKRTTFQEITEAAVQKAVASPRLLDLNLVSAQESRRAIDRLVGYQISPVLWRKLESGLSAGRVQSVALRLAVEREGLILAFADQFSFQVTGFFLTAKGDPLKAKKREAFATETDAGAYLQSSVHKTFSVSDILTRPVEKTPPPPHSTASLQQDGVRKMKMSVKRVMEVAQKLFEGGHITYMRTDSLNLSDTAVAEAKGQITAQFGPAYFQERHFKSKAGSQEAHEAIRPTHWENPAAGDSPEEQKLYDLIRRRALASQMKPARYEETTITIVSNVPGDVFATTARILTFEGYLKVYQEEAEEEAEENGTIQPVSIGEKLGMLRLEARQVYAKPPKRFDQASLVAELEKKAIGRPSTYASILSTLLQREYVQPGDASGRKVTAALLILEAGQIRRSQQVETLGADKHKLIPTPKGTRLTRFLEVHFSKVVEYGFTAKCEELLDEIAQGKRSFAQLVPAFDRQLSGWLASVDQNTADMARQGEREIGQFEGLPLTEGQGKYGPYVKHGNRYYSLEGTGAGALSLPEAMALIERKRVNQPKALGVFEGKALNVGKGSYGTYVQHDGQYYPIEGKEPAEVTAMVAIAAIEGKRGQQKDQLAQHLVAQVGKKYQILRGKYGLYLTDGKTNASLPRHVSAEEAAAWTVEQCRHTLTAYLDRKKKKSR